MGPIGDPRVNPNPEPEEPQCPWGMCNTKMNTSSDHTYCKRMFAVRFKQHVNTKYDGTAVDLDLYYEEDREEFQIRFDGWKALHGEINTVLDNGTLTNAWSFDGKPHTDNWLIFMADMPERTAP